MMTTTASDLPAMFTFSVTSPGSFLEIVTTKFVNAFNGSFYRIGESRFWRRKFDHSKQKNDVIPDVISGRVVLGRLRCLYTLRLVYGPLYSPLVLGAVPDSLVWSPAPVPPPPPTDPI